MQKRVEIIKQQTKGSHRDNERLEILIDSLPTGIHVVRRETHEVTLMSIAIHHARDYLDGKIIGIDMAAKMDD